MTVILVRYFPLAVFIDYTRGRQRCTFAVTSFLQTFSFKSDAQRLSRSATQDRTWFKNRLYHVCNTHFAAFENRANEYFSKTAVGYRTMRIESVNTLVVSHFRHAYDVCLDTRVNATLKIHSRTSKLGNWKVSIAQDRNNNSNLLYLRHCAMAASYNFTTVSTFPIDCCSKPVAPNTVFRSRPNGAPVPVAYLRFCRPRFPRLFLCSILYIGF